MFYFISPAENKRLLELEIEVQNLKIQTEELKTKLQSSEENKRLRKCKKLEAKIRAADPKRVMIQMWVVRASLIKGGKTLLIITSHALILYSLQKWLDILNTSLTFHV